VVRKSNGILFADDINIFRDMHFLHDGFLLHLDTSSVLE